MKGEGCRLKEQELAHLAGQCKRNEKSGEKKSYGELIEQGEETKPQPRGIRKPGRPGCHNNGRAARESEVRTRGGS